jgi:hypothetical protein
VQVANNTQKGFLRRVLGIFSLTEHTVTQTINLTAKPLDKLTERWLMTGQTPIYKDRKFFTQDNTPARIRFSYHSPAAQVSSFLNTAGLICRAKLRP